MNTDAKRMQADIGLKGRTDVTEAVIGAAFRVINELGCGFVEKVYENALALELRWLGYRVEQQRAVGVWYKGEQVGLYQPDLVVDDSVIVELKAVAGLDRTHRTQCLNYLRATHLETGLVLNFGRPRLDVQRVICPRPWQ
jgi:GxxExxY protein